MEKSTEIQTSHTQQILQKILHVDMVPESLVKSVDLLKQKNFEALSNSMPIAVAKAVEVGVPMRLVERVAKDEMIAFIEFELIKLSTMVNVDARLNLQRHQVPLIAESLYEDFKNESMEDIAVCFKRGAMGKYADEKGIFRIDGAVISQWMSRYLVEKYELFEANLTKAKQKEAEVRRESNGKSMIDLYKAIVGDTPPDDPSNAPENSFQRWKVDNPRQKFNIRGLEIWAVSKEEAEKLVQRMIDLGEVEEDTI
jgi:hypothetical protein